MHFKRSTVTVMLVSSLMTADFTLSASASPHDDPHSSSKKTAIAHGSNNNVSNEEILIGNQNIVGTGHTVASGSSSEARASVDPQSGVAIEVFSQDLNGLQTVPLPGFTCPAATPYLVNYNYSPGRLVPLGVQVEEGG
ncbi:hypothetical protein [Streptomyces osmaniensis]|uniref:hypothetical protein n=1 Tax=Streptomyces osmaniensis TaxID=593134 RepID=UPI0031FC94E5